MICAEYARQGFDLTLRQLYYQFVSRDLLPNTQQSYNRLGAVVSDARMAGMLDWSYLVDRTRGISGGSGSWDDPVEYMTAAADGYWIDLWQGQPVHIEVWVEKEALAGVVARAVRPFEAVHLSCRGYLSMSEAYVAGQRFTQHIAQGQRVLVLHLGDHDPSGLDMTRDNRDRLTRFITTNLAGRMPDDDDDMNNLLYEYGSDYEPAFTLRRIALNRDQIARYNPPPNPAKMTDSRIGDYIALHGRQSWELDALPPQALMTLIREELTAAMDMSAFEARQAEQQTIRERMVAMVQANADMLTEGDG